MAVVGLSCGLDGKVKVAGAGDEIWGQSTLSLGRRNACAVIRAPRKSESLHDESLPDPEVDWLLAREATHERPARLSNRSPTPPSTKFPNPRPYAS